jgi:hypothetical protein
MEEPALQRRARMMTWKPTAEFLRPFLREVEFFTDCTEPGKPVYRSLEKLAGRHATYTGYANATPIPSWDEARRVGYWKRLQWQARRALIHAQTGEWPPGKKRSVTTKRGKRKVAGVATKTYERFQPNPKKFSSNAERQKAYRARTALRRTPLDAIQVVKGRH